MQRHSEELPSPPRPVESIERKLIALAHDSKRRGQELAGLAGFDWSIGVSSEGSRTLEISIELSISHDNAIRLLDRLAGELIGALSASVENEGRIP